MAAIPPVRVPVEVEVIRPRLSWEDSFALLLANMFATLLIAWLLMLIVPAVSDYAPGYVDTLLILVGVRLLQRSDNFRLWTKDPRPIKKRRS